VLVNNYFKNLHQVICSCFNLCLSVSICVYLWFMTSIPKPNISLIPLVLSVFICVYLWFRTSALIPNTSLRCLVSSLFTSVHPWFPFFYD